MISCNCKSMSNTSLPNNSCRLVLFDETVVMPMAKIWSDIISKVLTYGVGQSMLEWNVKRQFDLRSGSHYTSLSLIHISEPTRRTPISYAVFCLKKKKTKE